MFLQNGSLRLFRLWGVTVFVNWSWLLYPLFVIWRRSRPDPGAQHFAQSIFVEAALCLCLFAIVLIHEFGHALACKSVGGTAERIVLWPLGGLAFVKPPQRAGAVLWSIAAGPLVNVALLPLTWIPALFLGLPLNWGGTSGPGAEFLWYVAVMNTVLLVFNMLPIYPLDGGQIFRALLWFICGAGLSLVIAASCGLAGAGVLALVSLYLGMPWLAVMVVFMGLQSLVGLRVGLGLMKLEQRPRRLEVTCPACGVPPPIGPYWTCPCGTRFDTFETHAHCPRCGRGFEATRCAACGQSTPLAQWYPQPRGFETLTVPPVSTEVPR
jgi:Zn-dependent protease